MHGGLTLFFHYDNILCSDHESGVSKIATAAGSASGALVMIILSLVIVIPVVLYYYYCLKRRQKAFNLTSNVAYTGQCTTKFDEDIDYYSISQPPAGTSCVEIKDEHSVVTRDTAANESTEDQPLSMLYDTIDAEPQPTTDHVPKTNEAVQCRRSIEHCDIENEFSQPSSVLYDTVDENTAEVPQSGGSPAMFICTSVIEVPEINSEPVFPLTENVAYTVSSNSSPVDLEAQQPHGVGRLVQNVAYEPTTVLLSPNVAYESHDQGTQELNQDRSDYI